MATLNAEAIKTQLAMKRHPEGGWYAETFRDAAGGERGASTAIYFLLEKGDRSAWHRVADAVEIWHFYAGAPLRLVLSEHGTSTRKLILGQDLADGQYPQHIVPAGCWQMAESLGAWTLVGCTVAPGFVFENFEMAPAGWEPAG